MLTFAGCRLDVDGRRLLRDGRPMALEPQAFDVLVLLAENRDRVVSKEEILDSVWGDRWVSESALTTRIKEIRRAVGDTGEAQAVVRTVRGRGYQLVAAVEGPAGEAAPDAALIGRDRDFQSVAQRLRPGALVTLVGPGGVGKTTLGRSLASHLRADFHDGCFPIDLTVVRDRDELFAVVARALQIVDASSDTLPTLLRGFDALLLLDDADELVSEVADLCQAIGADESSRVTLLVTCRERLGVAGEQIWPVLPLASAAAVELLQKRAAQLAPLGSLVDLDPGELSEFTALVDNLPLAIEMLASASAHLGRRELVDLVATTPENLTDPRRNAPTRHRSLDALVAASLDQLDATSAQALEAISSFAGPFRLGDAAAVCGLGPGGLGVVRDLVDRSLLAPSISDEEGPRFQMLRTVVRAVRRRMDDTARQRYERDHATWVAAELEVADRLLRSEEEGSGAERFAALADDARIAHAWARANDLELALTMTASLHLYAHSRLWAEPAQWAEAVPEWRRHGRALAAAASQASQEARFDDAADLGRLALADDDPRVRAWALEVLSDVEIYRGELDAAIRHAADLVALGVAHGDTRMIALGTANGVLARVYSGDPAGALEHSDGYPWGGPASSAPTDLAWLAVGRGEALDVRQRTEEAVEQLELAASLADSVDSRFVAGVARSTLGGIERSRGDIAAAAGTYRHLIATFSRHGIATHLAIALRNTVPLLIDLGREREASLVCGWLFGPHGRTGYGPDLDLVETARARLRAGHPEVTAQWEREGASMTVIEAAAFALTTLDAASATTSG